MRLYHIQEACLFGEVVMIKEVEDMNWEEYLGLDLDLFDKKAVEKFEVDYGIKFPSEYFSLILPYQGKLPEARQIRIRNVIEGVGPVFHFLENTNEMCDSYEMRYMKDVIDAYPSELIPILGAGASGSLFALDFSNKLAPNVVLINFDYGIGEENSVIKVASSIQEFLDQLFCDDE